MGKDLLERPRALAGVMPGRAELPQTLGKSHEMGMLVTFRGNRKQNALDTIGVSA